MHWMVPINSLDPQQTRILEAVSTEHDKTHWISGYAGTGKTIVITHAIDRICARTRSAKICFLTYTWALRDLVESGLSSATRGRVTLETVDTFKSTGMHYDYILVDEIQDIKEDLIGQILRRGTHVIAAGDPDQSIYLGRVNPNELRHLLGGARKHTLKNIQRLTQTTFQLGSSILPEAEIVAGATVKDIGGKGKIIKGTSRDDEFQKVFAEAFRVSSIEQPCAILFPTHNQIHDFASNIAMAKRWGHPPSREKRGVITSYEAFNHFFQSRNAPLRFLGSNNGSLPESDQQKLIYLMTYHSAKGLDFNNVFLPDLTNDVKLDAKWQHLSKWDNERRHLFVAVTRCKESIYLSYHGTPHPLLQHLMDTLPENLQAFVPPRSTLLRR